MGEGAADRAHRSATAGAIALAVLAVAVYLNSLWNGFVHDDHFQVAANPWIRDFGHIPEIFSSPAWGFWGRGGNSYYRPLMHMGYAVVNAVFGTAPAGYHLLNVALHAANTVLAFRVALRLGSLAGRESLADPLRFALVAGAIFAVHPIHTEVVALVAALPELFFSLFFLLGWLAWPVGPEAAEGGKRRLRESVSAGCFMLSLLSKETGLMLFPFVFVVDLILARRLGVAAPVKGRFLRYLPYVAVLGAYLAIRWRVFGGLTAGVSPDGRWTPLSIGATSIDLLGRYLVSLAAPLRLNFLHLARPVVSPADAGFLFHAALAAAATAFAIRALRKDALSAAGWMLLLVPLVPVLYPPALAMLYGEHNLYLPALGFSMLVAAAADRTVRIPGIPRRWAAVATGLALAALAVLTVARNPVYRDDTTLWADVARKLGNESPVRFHRGYRLLEAGELEAGIREMRAALAAHPGYPDAAYNIGIAYVKLGNDEAAAPFLEQAVAERPGDVAARATLAALLFRQGRLAESLREYEALVRLDPGDPDARRKAEAVRAMLDGAQ